MNHFTTGAVTLKGGGKSRSYWDILCQDILNDRLLRFFILFTGVACFGFALTHFSIGIDDPARNYYLYSENTGNMIQQGRLMHVLLNKLTRTVAFIPFFSDFVGASLFVFSHFLFCALFQYITDGKMSRSSLIAFACVSISTSILTEKFIYELDVIVTMLSYCCMAVALLYAYRFLRERRLALLLKGTAALMMSIASYESFVTLYICCVFAILILEMLVNPGAAHLPELLLEGLQYAGTLLLSLVLYYGLVWIVQAASGQLGAFNRVGNTDIMEVGVLSFLQSATQQIFTFFMESIAQRYPPILFFCALSGLGMALFGFLAFKQKNIWLFICFAAMFAGNFLIHYVLGEFTSRAAQTLCIFDGFVLMVLLQTAGGRAAVRKALCAFTALLVFVQCADMNRWFYNDYVRYEKETYVIHTLATELLAEYDITKPVVFTGTPSNRYLDTDLYLGAQLNGNSVIYWSIDAFAEAQQPFVAELFRMHGYDFVLSPTSEQYDRAVLEAEGMPTWPQDGCIRELEDMIIVHF